MAVTIQETEGAPAAWPAVTPYPRAAELDPLEPAVTSETVWRMIERWITARWRTRSVTYVVEGPGDWQARLTPFTAIDTEIWTGTSWAASAPRPSPLGGYCFDAEGPYRITGTAGDASDVPDDVQEAWRRLHSYMIGNGSAVLDELAVYRTEDREAPRAYAAQAIRLSGAGDLLRPYRRLS